MINILDDVSSHVEEENDLQEQESNTQTDIFYEDKEGRIFDADRQLPMMGLSLKTAERDITLEVYQKSRQDCEKAMLFILKKLLTLETRNNPGNLKEHYVG